MQAPPKCCVTGFKWVRKYGEELLFKTDVTRELKCFYVIYIIWSAI